MAEAVKYELLLYADDTCLIFQHNDLEIQLNKIFSLICDWFAENKLSIYFGVHKTKSVLFSSKHKIKKPSPLNIQYKDKLKIRQYKKVTYLGCILLEAFCGECMARSIFLCGQNKFLGILLRRLLCNTIIQPFFDYACKAWYLNCFFFLSVFSFTDRWFTEQQRTTFRSTLPLPPAHKHWNIYLQLCMWDDYHVFLIATFVFTRLLLDEIYHHIRLPFDWLTDDAMFVCFLDELILGFCYSDLTWETDGFEFALTITLVLQANQLIRCASHP